MGLVVSGWVSPSHNSQGGDETIYYESPFKKWVSLGNQITETMYTIKIKLLDQFGSGVDLNGPTSVTLYFD